MTGCTIHYYSDVFDDTKPGTLPGKASLVVNDNATPVMLPARQEPIATRYRLKSELTQLVNLGIITSVEEPTELVSQMSVQAKRSGKWRICLDPRPLNKALSKEQYQLPTLEEILCVVESQGIL